MTELAGKKIGTTGYGLMGLTWRAKPASDEQAFKAMKAALDNGCNFWNGGELYGTDDYNSLHLLEKYFTKYPEDASKVVLSIKGGLGENHGPDGSYENLKRCIDKSLAILNGKKSIDIYEMARVDKNVPLETTMKALEEFVKAGKIGGISLSEVGVATINKAASITKIVAVEVELSLWSTDILTNGVAAACAKNNIPVVAYSPIGRGMLTGQIKSPADLPEGDFRRSQPRFQGDAFETNLELVRELEKLAKQKGCTPAQLAIGWVKSQSKKNGNPEFIPIPGATTEERVKENAKDVKMSDADLSEIDSILGKFQVVGARYGGAAATLIEG